MNVIKLLDGDRLRVYVQNHLIEHVSVFRVCMRYTFRNVYLIMDVYLEYVRIDEKGICEIPKKW